ncbi:MAG: hypothetical protein R3281_07345 [Balneolaceae bacterium]|nr:hypothetical protein [Balneolaceae bacterium]
MTYCLGIKTREGLMGLADTRITSGTQTTTARKIFTVNRPSHSYFIMTSGLRSVRDKVLTYFREKTEGSSFRSNKLYMTANTFSEQVKRVAREDKEALEEANLSFNLYAILGGQLESDSKPKLYLVYPQGNWIEIGEDSPYAVIGNTGFGRPILQRSLSFGQDLEFAMKTAFLSFDITRLSCNDVGYPVDSLILRNDSYHILEHRFQREELSHISNFWESRLRGAINQLPADAFQKALYEREVTPIKLSS